MTTIPKDIIIPIEDFQRAALKSLMEAAPPDYELTDLVQLILAKGLQTLLVGRDLPEVTRQLAEPPVEEGPAAGRVPRVASNYIGFPVDVEQEIELNALLREHRHLCEEEVCRIVFDFGLHAVQTYPFGQKLLASTRPRHTPDPGSNQ